MLEKNLNLQSIHLPEFTWVVNVQVIQRCFVVYYGILDNGVLLIIFLDCWRISILTINNN